MYTPTGASISFQVRGGDKYRNFTAICGLFYGLILYNIIQSKVWTPEGEMTQCPPLRMPKFDSVQKWCPKTTLVYVYNSAGGQVNEKC